MITYLFFCLALVSYFDIKRQQIPDILTVAVALACLYYGFHWAGIIPFCVFFLCAVIAAAFKSPMPFGMGDAKLLSAIALSFGVQGLTVTYIAASLAAAVYSAILLIMKKTNKKDRIAFGPFIAFGFVVFAVTI